VSESHIVVLNEQVTATDVASLAASMKLTLVDETTRGWFVLATRTWASPDGSQLTYVEDHTADARWLHASGTGSSRIATMLRERLPHYDLADLLSLAESTETPRTCIQVLCRLVPHRPDDCDPHFLAAWKRMLTHPVQAVRRAAIRTAYGCRWPELRTLVQQCLRTEKELVPQLEQLLALFDDD
jgi:hypothetical protein